MLPTPLLLLLLILLAGATTTSASPPPPRYAPAPTFLDAASCPRPHFPRCLTPCDPSHAHIAMTLDAAYLRGSVAAVHSILTHTPCPSLVFFHFVADATHNSTTLLRRILISSFPSLNFYIHRLHPHKLSHLISPALRPALDNPLNYARNYLASVLPSCVHRIVYLDSDVIVVDDIRKLFSWPMPENAVIAAPEYCHANFTRYFTPAFWSDGGAEVFNGRRRKPCYFNTGVMLMEMGRWREGGYTERIEGWMKRQREGRIYELGSLPPLMLVFAGDIEAVEHRWNQHGLGGDSLTGECRVLHQGPVSLLHWSGKGKPWDRLDTGEPCAVDHLWAPYDLYIPSQPRKVQAQVLDRHWTRFLQVFD